MRYLVLTITFIALSSCQKKEVSAESIKSSPPNQQQGEVPPPPSTPTPTPAPTPSYPKAEIEYSEYVWINQNDDIHIHVVLSEASNNVITMQLSLADSTAVYPRDYLGFYAGDPLTQTLVFAPGERIIHLPSVMIPARPTCGSKFLVKLSAGVNEKVRLGTQSDIFLNCK